MKHNISVKGQCFSLRPVTIDDAEAIIRIRTTNPERSKYTYPMSQDVNAQIKWIKEYYERENDYYFAAMNNYTDNIEGVFRIRDIVNNCGHLSSLAFREGSKALTEVALLRFIVAFDILKLDEIHGYIVTENQRSLNYSRSAGFVFGDVLPKHAKINGNFYDEITFFATREMFENETRKKLTMQVDKISMVISRWCLANKTGNTAENEV